MPPGRSDYPNQVNNVLGFPFIFRGALDVRATAINEEMKLAATHALADLAKEDVPDSVCRAYGVPRLQFGREYLIPKPFDPRVLMWEASAVAEAAMHSGVAQEPVDLAHLPRATRATTGQGLRSFAHHDSQGTGESKAGRISRGRQRENSARLPRAGRRRNWQSHSSRRACQDSEPRSASSAWIWKACRSWIPPISGHREAYVQELFRLRQRRGVTLREADTLINNRNVFGSMMVHMGDADALVSGVTQHFPDTIRPALQIVRMREGLHRVSGCYAVITRKGEVFFLADTSVNIEPTAEDLVEIALCTAHMARRFDLVPRVAMLSFSSFGGVDHPICDKVRKAVEDDQVCRSHFDRRWRNHGRRGPVSRDDRRALPFSSLKGGANVLIFPDLASANIATANWSPKIGGGELIGPILMGMSRPVHVLQRSATVEEIVNVAAIAVVDAQENDTYAASTAYMYRVEPELVGED